MEASQPCHEHGRGILSVDNQQHKLYTRYVVEIEREDITASDVVATLLYPVIRDRTKGPCLVGVASTLQGRSRLLTSSAKAKGRRLQQYVAKTLFEGFSSLYPELARDDIKSTSMGVSGVDILLSPLARKLIPLAIECKHREQLVVPTVFEQHHAKYKESREVPVLVHRRNRSETLVTLRWSDFLEVLLDSQRQKPSS